MQDSFEPGTLVFTGARGGVLLGYVEHDAGDDKIERKAVVARFTSSEEVDPAELSASPVRSHDDGEQAGQVPAEPTHDDTQAEPVTTGSDPASVGVYADRPSEADVQTAQTTPEAQAVEQREASAGPEGQSASQPAPATQADVTRAHEQLNPNPAPPAQA